MNKSLPDNASLEHLKSQAKDLLRDMRSSQPESKLHQAQHRLAQDYGFDSWPKLSTHVEALTLARLGLAEKIKTIEHGIRMGRYAERAKQLLEQDPSLTGASFSCALAALDEDRVRSFLAANSVNEPVGDMQVVPIVALAFSPLAAVKLDAYDRLLALLISMGADVNATYQGPDFPDNPFSVLYGAVGVARSPSATKLLLEAGANPDDNESLYHSTETRDHSCLKLLLDHKATIKGTNALARMLDFEDPEGLTLFVKAGADLNDLGALHHALRRGRSVQMLELLMSYGADPNLPDANGITPRQLMFERGLVVKGVSRDFVPSDQDLLLAACWAGDVERAASLHLAAEGLPTYRRKAFTDACWAGQAQTVDAFLAGGFSLLDRDDSGGTPLHCASFSGSLATVQALLRHGAPLDNADNLYGSPPLVWAAYASEYNDGDSFPKVVRALIEAGSPRPGRLLGSDDVRDILSAKWNSLDD